MQRSAAGGMNLIVGGTGFIGGHLAEYFFQEGEISKGMFRKGSHLRVLDQCGIQCLEADPLDRASLHEPMEMVNVVYNLASPTPDHEEPADFLAVNTRGLLNLLEEASEHGVKDFVHLSTLDVYGFKRKRVGADGDPVAPTHPYQAAKLQAEKLAMDFAKRKDGPGEMRVKVVRAARATGPRDTTLALPILKMIESGRVVLPSGSESPMSFTHPRDVAKALFKAASAAGTGKTYQVKSFDSSLDELVASVMRAWGKSSEIRHGGLFSKSILPPYAASQVKAGLLLEKQASWGEISYAPEYDLERTGRDIAEWRKKEPWLTEDERT